MRTIFAFVLISVFSVCNAITFNHFDDYEGKVGDTKAAVSKSAQRTKMYVDNDDMETNGRIFRLHIGENIWLSVSSVHSDQSGLFVYEDEIVQDDDYSIEYKKNWKCPYCFRHWPIGTPCQNPDCPSKFK